MGIAADMGDPASSSGDRGSKYVSGSEVSASRAGNVGGTSDLHQALGIERERAAKWETLAKSLERKVVALEIDLMRFAQKKPLNVLPQEVGVAPVPFADESGFGAILGVCMDQF